MKQLNLFRPLNDKHGSHARWSRKPDGTLLIFVHGFAGNALSTWQQFPLLSSRIDLEPADVIFFGHDGGRTQVESLVGRLYKFSDSIISNPRKTPAFPAERDGSFRYSKIIFCGHSLGCVLIRDALIAAAKNNAEWFRYSRMVLFAPAHKGVHAGMLAKEKALRAFGMFGQLSLGILYQRYLAVYDLKPDSPYLKKLEAGARDVFDTHLFGGNIIASRVVHGEKDSVVEFDQFFRDPYPPETIDGKGHSDVCKPKPLLYEEPFTIVSSVVGS